MGRLVSPTKRKRSVSPASKDLHHTPDTPTLPAALYRPLEAPAKAEFADFKERRNPFKGDHLKLSKLILSRPQDQIKEDSQALTRLDLPLTMPYNTAAIPPPKEPSGTTQLPLSRVKKIINVDPDTNTCSANAAYVITIATEMFIQHLAEQAHNVVKSERKPRRNIQYRDLSSAVSRNDNLEFLADIVPKTVPYKEVKEKKPPAARATNGESSMEHGQTTLEGSRPAPPPLLNGSGSGMNGIGHEGANDDGDDSTIADPDQQLQMEIRGARMSSGSISNVMNGEDQNPRDVEMSQ